MCGFTLIELLIAMTIAAILAAIAVPAYQDHVTRTRRADAQGALAGLAHALERHHTQNGAYTGAAAGGADTGAPAIFPTQAPLEGEPKAYDLAITAADATGFTVRATPIGPQVGDGIMELDSTGARRWDRDNSGTFGGGETGWGR